MERIQSTAVAALLALALLAGACSGDDAEEVVPDGPTTTPTPPESTTTTQPADVGINDVLGTQAVQDFTIYFGMWKLDGEQAVDVYEPLLDHVSRSSGDVVALVGGSWLAPTSGLAARVVDPQGRELPSLSVDFGLFEAPDAMTTDVQDRLFAALQADGSTADGAEMSLVGAKPLLVEIVTADYASARTHVAPGDRTELDVTIVDEVEPGDSVATLSLFGQTLPGAPSSEVGLSPFELFRQRWNQGLVRVAGDGSGPVADIDSSVRVQSGSTILSRETKHRIARNAGIVAALVTPSDIERQFERTLVVDSERENRNSTAGFDVTGDGSDDIFVQLDVGSTGGTRGSIRFGTAEDDSPWLVGDFDAIVGIVAMMRYLAACHAVAAALVANNEAARGAQSATAIAASIAAGTNADDADADSDDGESGAEPEPPTVGCNEPPENQGFPFPSGPRGGVAYGDVRITTMDGTFYSNNAAGEFLLYRDEAATVQMRLEPWVTGRLGVSVATAAAIEVDGHELSLHLDGSAWIDGEPADFGRGEIRALGPAEVTWWGDGWVVIASDGTLIRVDENVFSFVIRVDPAESAVPTGLLGDADGDPGNDLVLRDGTPFSGDPKRDFERLYAEYIESWRVSADESQFHYEPGESTDSFTIEGFPTDRAVIDELTGEERAFGEEACAAAGVFVEGDLLDACIVDVAVTGEPALALDSFDAQVLAFERELSLVESGPIDVTAETPGDTVLTIGDETLVFGENPPNQRDGGVVPTWDCRITDGNLFADGRIDPADGPRYSITVQYLATEPRFTLTVQRTIDDQTSDYAWVLTNVAHFADSFDGVTIDDARLSASGELYVNDPPNPGLAPFSQLPDGAALVPFILDLGCVS